MSLERVKAYLETEGILDRLKVFHESSATVELAAGTWLRTGADRENNVVFAGR